MGKKLIISYNYGANVVILIGFVFLFVISYENILTLIVGLILLAIFFVFVNKENPYIEIDNTSILLKYFDTYKLKQFKYDFNKIEKIEIYNNPKELRNHKTCIYIKLSNNNDVVIHQLGTHRKEGNQIIQKLKESNVNIIELDFNK
ncbi:MAG: hypothetical protein IPO62_11940 [Saprospiraceae bacterium]|nr:hypothetical protein [Saprospiraceae bacterium]